MAFKKRPHESLEYVSGDIVEHDAEVLVNTVNSRLSERGNPVMGKGVAEAFRDKWGDAVMKPYADAIRSGELRPGRAILFDLPDGRKWAALATKDDWRDKSQMQWVESGLKELGDKLREGGYRSVAITPPGCGNGGLDWKKVEPILHRELEGVNVHMFARPSGAMVDYGAVERMQAERTNPAVLAKKRDEGVRKELYGKIVDEPYVDVETSHLPGRSTAIVSMSVRESADGRAIPVHFRSEEMENRDLHKAVADFDRLKKGSEVSLGGRWAKGNSGAWGFVAVRVAEGRIPASGLKSTHPSPKVIADPHFADLLAGGPDTEAVMKSPEAGSVKRDDLYPINESTPVKEKASMYFSFDLEGRPDVKSNSTFDAILEGERTSTTRYDKWPGSDRWGKLEKGDLIRFYEDKGMKGRSVVVAVDSVERIDMRTMDDKQREAWSRAEGWSEGYARKSASNGPGFQIRYRPVPGQEILEGRGAQLKAAQMESDALARSTVAKKDGGFDFEAATAPAQDWDRGNASVFLKTNEKFGSLSNMCRGHGYKDGHVFWPSSEAQYQALKFPDHPEIQEQIRDESNAFLAKKVAWANKDKVRKDWDEVSVEAMAYVLTRKYDASPAFRADLAEAAANGKQIVEISNKSTFWGASQSGSGLRGQNVLGRLENQLHAGARQDELPRGSRLIGLEEPSREQKEEQKEEQKRKDMDVLTGGRMSRMQRPGMMAALSQGIGR